MDRAALPLVLVWDLPVRLFHALLALLFVATFGLATTSSDASLAFALHAALGTIVVFLVALRLVWTLPGTHWARLGALELRPRALVAYLRSTARTSPAVRYVGHNPATSWFMVAAFALVAGLGATGYLLGRGHEAFEDAHEAMAWTLLGLAALHVAGVAWHRLRHGENLAVAMVTGGKRASRGDGIPSARPWSALVFLLAVAGWSAVVVDGVDRATGRLALPLVGAPLQITEVESATGSTAVAGREDDDD